MTPDEDVPPWELGPTGDVKQRLTVAGVDALELVVDATGCLQLELLDLLLRALSVDQAVELVRERRLRDGAARAAWQRTRRG